MTETKALIEKHYYRIDVIEKVLAKKAMEEEERYIFAIYAISLNVQRSHLDRKSNLGKVSKKPNLFGTLSQTMGRWVQRWVQSPKLFSENNHSVIFTANIQKCPKTCNT